MTKRILHISKIPSEDCLFGSDYNGRVHKMNLDLETVCQSDPLPGIANGLYAITCNQRYVYGRDMQGNLIQWHAADLSIARVVHLRNIGDSRERTSATAIPTVSHGIFLWEDRIMVVSPYGDLLQFDADTLEYIKKTALPAQAFVESFDGSIDDCHVVSDCAGYAWYGHLDQGFEQKIRLDFGPIHCLRYDPRHHRHWMTTDNHGGLSVVGLRGDGIHRITFTTDDVEWFAFNEDASRAYVACFDHYLHVLDNEQKVPKHIRKIGPFKFQLKQVLYVSPERIYVLLESGEIYQLNEAGEIGRQAASGTDCIWDIAQDPHTHNRVYCPMENGGYCHVEYDALENGTFKLQVIDQKPSYGFGRMRRLKPLQTSGFIAGFTDGTVARIDATGKLVWLQNNQSIVRDIDISSDQTRCLAVSENGRAVEYNVQNGEIIWQQNFDKPLWACCYRGDDMLLSERCRSERDENTETTIPIAHMYLVNGETKEFDLSIELHGNVKRIKCLANGHILFNGNGDVSAIEYDIDSKKALKIWSAWQLNTCEDMQIFEDHVYTITYGYQVNSYRYSGEIIDSQFSLDNYPKALYSAKTSDGIPVLLVGGRGPYLSMYRINAGKPEIVQTLYVHPDKTTSLTLRSDNEHGNYFGITPAPVKQQQSC